MTKHIQEKDPAKKVPLSDIIAPGLDVLFCGINPGLLAAATGYPFAGRGNRFWRTLHLSGFTSREFVPSEAQQLLAAGCGITSVVERATAGVSDLSPDEFMESREAFVAKVARYSPRFVAFLGKAGLVGVTGRSRVEWGRQDERVANSIVWLLPNPSGRNLAFSLGDLVGAFALLRHAASASSI